MALEAVVFQQADLFGYNSKDLYSLLGGNWSYDFGLEEEEEKLQEEKICLEHFPDNQTISSETNNSTFLHHHYGDQLTSSSSPTSNLQVPSQSSQPHFNDDATNTTGSTSCDPSSAAAAMDTSTNNRPKRRRSKTRKNKEEIENQRMTHIAVERNRRKQMNEYLSVLRSLMPESYVQRGDQASIIGGAINFVKELEHRLQLLSAQKEVKEKSDGGNNGGSSSPFAEFFTFPQFSTLGDHHHQHNSISMNETSMVDDQITSQSAIADIEVTMVESHANLKIRSKRRRPGQLLKMVSGLNSMRLSILHLNVTTVDQTVLYSLSVKVEDDCKLTSVDDIATAVNQLLGRIQEVC